MPVLAKFGGIVIRMLIDRTFGTHFHVFYGDSEMVVGVNPTRVIQGEVPAWVRESALDWVSKHQSGSFPRRNGAAGLPMRFSGDASESLAFPE